MVKKRKKIEIKEIFSGLQHQMRAKLTLNRKILTHPVSKGDASELEWIEMLSAYLPERYKIDKAFVVDSKGSISDQIDIVIFDRHYSPFMLRQNGATYLPAESVYAVIEVKPALTKAHLKYASNKAASVRKLHRTSATIVHAEGEVKKPKEPFPIIAGILTIEGKLTNPLEKYLYNLPAEKRLDFGCSLDQEAFWFRSDSGANEIYKIGKNQELIFFFLNLFSELQRRGTVPAIDIPAYFKEMKKR